MTTAMTSRAPGDPLVAVACHSRNGRPKATFRSQAKARREARRMMNQRWVTGRVNVYECPRCGDWHVTGAEYREYADQVDRRRHGAA
jgi:hypothetical protein